MVKQLVLNWIAALRKTSIPESKRTNYRSRVSNPGAKQQYSKLSTSGGFNLTLCIVKNVDRFTFIYCFKSQPHIANIGYQAGKTGLKASVVRE